MPTAQRMPPPVYTPEQRAFAKTLVVAHGNVAAARRHLEQLWIRAEADGERPEGVPEPPPAVPTVATLTAWRDSALIPVDRRIVDEFQSVARSFVAGSALRIATEAEAAVLMSLKSGEAGDAEKYGKVWAQAVSHLAPRDTASQQNGTLPLGPGQLAPGQTAIMTFTVQGATTPAAPVQVGTPPLVVEMDA